MKRTELERHLGNHGCLLHHHGGNHDVWWRSRKYAESVGPKAPRNQKGTVQAICGRLDLPLPAGLLASTIRRASGRGRGCYDKLFK